MKTNDALKFSGIFCKKQKMPASALFNIAGSPAGILAMAMILGIATVFDAPAQQTYKLVQSVSSSEDDAQASASATAGSGKIVIRSLEPAMEKREAREQTWLGVSVGEAPEALSAQLGLSTGVGLVVQFISKDSPAAKAGLERNDVLSELDGQLLVDSIQLRKLIQMHTNGDDVKITYFHAGKKSTATAHLTTKAWSQGALEGVSRPEGLDELKLELKGLKGIDGSSTGYGDSASYPIARSGYEREKIDREVERTMEMTRKAIRDALNNSARSNKAQHQALVSVEGKLAAMSGGGVDLGTDSTVVITSDDKSTKTIVKSDGGGSYVITEDPKKHLVVHDKKGKLVFNGEIETPEQQQKVPKEIWARAKPLIEQMHKAQDEASENAAPVGAPEKQELIIK